MSPKHAQRSTRSDPAVATPRASDMARARQRQVAWTTEPARRRLPKRRRTHWRPILAAVIAIPLLLSSLGTSPLSAAQRDVPDYPSQPVLAAEGDPTPTPKPTPTPRPTPWPTPAGIKGLDVSHWNGYPDFEKLRDQGMRFVFSKATQGTSFVDDSYRRHTREARSAGLVVGPYHFFDYNKGGVAQARHYLDTLRSTSGLGSQLPLVVDVETLGSLGAPNATMAKSRLHAMLDELYRQTGRYPMIYTSRFMWEKVVGGPSGFRQYPLWVACWECDTMHLPNGWNDWLFWQVGQFEFKGGTKLDGNTYSANMSKLRLERQRSMKLDSGAAWTTTRSVEADLRGYEGKEVRYANGDRSFGPWLPYKGRFDLNLSGKQGRQEIRLQLRSFRNVKSPILPESIRLDSVPPTMWGPHVSLRHGVRVQKSGNRVPTTIRMSANDDTSGLDSSSLKAICGGITRASAFRPAGTAGLTVQIDRHGCTLKGIADDAVGHRTSKSLDPTIALFDARGSSGRVRLNGDWKTLKNKGALGQTLARTATRDATAKLAFDGAQFAVVARRGPAGGRLKVILDGKHVDTIDLYAKSGDGRRIVYVRNVPKGKHELKLRATGTGSAKSAGEIVWLDAILVLDRRT